MIVVPLGFGGSLVEALFVARPNRFLVEALLDGAVVQAHLADRGRLLNTLVPGARLLLARASGAKRKTQFQAVAAYRGARLCSLDTHLPNRLVEAALRARALPPFARYTDIRREVTVGASRFDFQLGNGSSRCTLEVKSAGDVTADGVGTFPDAPSSRGARHLLELADVAERGERAAVLFVVQGQARAFAVNHAIDPQFAETLRAVAARGVEVHAVSCPLTRDGIHLGATVPVLLQPGS